MGQCGPLRECHKDKGLHVSTMLIVIILMWPYMGDIFKWHNFMHATYNGMKFI